VLEPLFEEPYDVVIVERVKNHLTGAAGANEPHAAKKPKLMGHRRFAQAEQIRDVADTQLVVRQGIEDPDTRRIPQDLERLRKRRDLSVGKKGRLEYMNICVSIHISIIAALFGVLATRAPRLN
jgi:hypothetical protein